MDLQDRPLKLGVKVPTAIYTASDEPVCVVDSMHELADDHTVARRLVACWNTCMGISTEALEGMPGHFFGAVHSQRKIDAEQARDELLKALQAVDVLFGHLATDSTQKIWIENARAAIAKAVGA